MRHLTILTILSLFCGMFSNGFAQTKKISNASHDSKGATFNWNTSDNLGLSVDYEQIQQVYDSTRIQIDTLEQVKLDSAMGIKSRSGDTIFLIDERVDEEVKACKTQKTPKSKVKKKTKKKKSKRVKETSVIEKNKPGQLKKEINHADITTPIETQKAFGSWMFVLLIPIGYLMFKKS